MYDLGKEIKCSTNFDTESLQKIALKYCNDDSNDYSSFLSGDLFVFETSNVAI